MQNRTRNQIDSQYLDGYLKKINVLISAYVNAHTWLFGYMTDQDSKELKQLSLDLDKIQRDTSNNPFEKYPKLLKATISACQKANAQSPAIYSIIKKLVVTELAAQDEAELNIDISEKVPTEYILSAIEKIEDKAFYYSSEDYAFCKKWDVITQSPVKEEFPFWIQMQNDIYSAFDANNYRLAATILDQTFNAEKQSKVRKNDNDKIFSQPGASEIADINQASNLDAHEIMALSKEKVKKELEIWTPDNLIVLFLDYALQKDSSVIYNNDLFIHLKTILSSMLESVIKATLINKLLYQHDNTNENDDVAFNIESIRNCSYADDNELLSHLIKFESHWKKIELYLSQQPRTSNSNHPDLTINKYGHLEELKKPIAHHDDLIAESVKKKLNAPVSEHKTAAPAARHTLRNIFIGGLTGLITFGGIGAALFFTGGLAAIPFLGIAITTLAAKITATAIFAGIGMCLSATGTAIVSTCRKPSPDNGTKIDSRNTNSDTKSMYRGMKTDPAMLTSEKISTPAVTKQMIITDNIQSDHQQIFDASYTPTIQRAAHK